MGNPERKDGKTKDDDSWKICYFGQSGSSSCPPSPSSYPPSSFSPGPTSRSLQLFCPPGLSLYSPSMMQGGPSNYPPSFYSPSHYSPSPYQASFMSRGKWPYSGFCDNVSSDAGPYAGQLSPYSTFPSQQPSSGLSSSWPLVHIIIMEDVGHPARPISHLLVAPRDRGCPYFKFRITKNMSPGDINKWFDTYQKKILPQIKYCGKPFFLILWDQAILMRWAALQLIPQHQEKGFAVTCWPTGRTPPHLRHLYTEIGSKDLSHKDRVLTSTSKKISTSNRHTRR